jgi:hypothetical protein
MSRASSHRVSAWASLAVKLATWSTWPVHSHVSRRIRATIKISPESFSIRLARALSSQLSHVVGCDEFLLIVSGSPAQPCVWSSHRSFDSAPK